MKGSKIIEQVSARQLMETVSWLTNRTPYRLAGSNDELKAAQYIDRRLSEYGLDSRILEFYAYNSIPRESELEILTDGVGVVASLPYAHIRSTPPEGRELEMVFVGAGGYQEYEGMDVRGKAVLVEVSYAPPVPEKARIAFEKGAVAIVCMNWGNDEGVICNRGLKGVWGNPTEKSFSGIPDIIGIGITRTDGLKLKEKCREDGCVSVRIKAFSDRLWSKVRQPFAVLKGNGASDEILLVCSHLDAWSPGVTCNATGNATTVEIARVLAEHRGELARDVYFVFWSGHEIAEAAGSTWFLDNFWHILNRKCVAYIHIDSTGVSGTEIFEIKASPELRSFAEDTYARFEKQGRIRSMNLKKIGDQSFMGIGIPSVTQRYSFTDHDIARANGATLGWWNHTCEDGIDKCSLEILQKDTQVTLQLIHSLATEEKLPYRIGDVFRDIQARLERIEKDYSDVVDLSALRDVYEKSRRALEEIVGRAESCSELEYGRYNGFLMKIARVLSPVIQTFAGKYEQDSYGNESLGFPIPLLKDLPRLKMAEEGTLLHGMLETQLRRNLNQLVDAFEDVSYLAGLFQRAFLEQ